MISGHNRLNIYKPRPTLAQPADERLTNWINGVDEDIRDGGATPAAAFA